MLRFGTLSTKNTSQQGINFFTTNYGTREYSLIRQQESYPLVDLPKSLKGIYFYATHLTFRPYELFPYNPKVASVPLPPVTIYLPQADSLLTEYGEKYLSLRFTIEVLKFNGIRAGIPQSSTEGDKWGVSYNVDIMKALTKESAGTAEGNYEKQIQKTIAFYTSH